MKAGDRVTRGQVLIQLDAREVGAQATRASASATGMRLSLEAAQAERRSAESAVVLARVTHNRVKGLLEKNSATAQELDQAVAVLAGAEARLAGATARVAEAEAGLAAAKAGEEVASVSASYAVLTAPFDGLVSNRQVDPGSMAAPGVPLLTIEDTSAYRLEVRVDESRAHLVAPGTAAEVRIDRGSAEDDGWAPADVAEVASVDPGAPQLRGEARPAQVGGPSIGRLRTRARDGPIGTRAGRAGRRGGAARATDAGVRRRRRRRGALAHVVAGPREPGPHRGAGRPDRGRPRRAGAARRDCRRHADHRRRDGGPQMSAQRGMAGKLAAAFIHSKLTPLLIVASLLLGVFATVALPREEEPQIIVPMIDVFVDLPGASPAEVEQRVTRPLEKLLWEVPGLEYLYSTSSPGRSMIVARFLVGEDDDRALVRINQKLAASPELVPAGASAPMVRARSIDDVPVMALTLWGEGYDDQQLRRLAAQLQESVKEVARRLGGHHHRRPAAAGQRGRRSVGAVRARPRPAAGAAGAGAGHGPRRHDRRGVGQPQHARGSRWLPDDRR